MAFGLIAAVFAALAAGALRRFVAADEISERLGIPVLGEVPVLVRARPNPAEMFKSAERRTRASRRSSNSKPPPRHVPGHAPGHRLHLAATRARGSPAVVSHTAWALATPGQFVVAVDGDLRQPTLHEIFGVPISRPV